MCNADVPELVKTTYFALVNLEISFSPSGKRNLGPDTSIFFLKIFVPNAPHNLFIFRVTTYTLPRQQMEEPASKYDSLPNRRLSSRYTTTSI